ncbi:MAG: N-acetyltransferase [candidate division WOR-3 bacterium]
MKSNGIFESHGPMGFTDLDPEGMLIEGFDELGTLPMIYNYEYYQQHMKKLGYEKDIDWVEFEVMVPKKIPEKILRVNDLVKEKLGISVLETKSTKELKKYALNIFEILNESYSNLYGFVPLDREQMEMYTDQYFGFINPDYVKIVVDKDKNPIGFGIAMPSLSKALQRSSGKIFPFGFIHILWALKFPRKIDLYLVAVKKEYQDLGVNALLITEIAKSCIKNKIISAETSGELENNFKIQSFWKYFEHRQHKRRRCYHKFLK